MINRYRLQICDIDNSPNSIELPIGVNHSIAITNDGKGIAEQLATIFHAHRYQCSVVTDIPPHCDVVILLDGLRHFTSIDEAMTCNIAVFQQAKRIAKRFSEKGGVLITVQDTGGQFGLTPFSRLQAWSAGLTGLIKTAAIEWPKAICKALDIEQAAQSPAVIANKIFTELTQGLAATECGLLADGKRVVPAVQAVAAQSGVLALANTDVIVVIGGGRGITASCIIELAKRTQATFAILGRTSLQEVPERYRNLSNAALKQLLFAEAEQNKVTISPKQINKQVEQINAALELQANLQHLRTAGATAEYFSVDILNADNLQTTLANIRKQYRTITAIIHGAGVLADKLLTDITEEQFMRVFNTKVIGLHNLLQATSNDPIRYIGLFSSVAARFGNAGQTAYAMGNEILNKVAQAERHRRGQDCLVKSYNWGPWDSGMVTPELKALFLKRGIVPLAENEGVRMFIDELTHANAQDVEIVYGTALNTPHQEKPYSRLYTVHQSKQPYLTSHVINDNIVIPACLVLDWFMRAVRDQHPQQSILSCRNFRVLNGLKWTINAEHPVEEFNVKIPSGNQLQLINSKGRICYSAEMSHIHDISIPSTLTTEEKAPTSWPWNLKEIYHPKSSKRILFHGKQFAAISQLIHLTKDSGSARLHGLKPLKWPAEDWASDVVILDGVLQLLFLWSMHVNQMQALPARIGEITLFSSALPQNELTCAFHCHTILQNRFISDAVLWQSDNSPYAILRNIEVICTTSIN